MSLIKLKHLTKQYEKILFNDATFTVLEGKMIAIRGVSGCGKTTLLNIISGFDTDFKGQYFWKEEAVKAGEIHKKVQKEISFVLQDIGLLTYLSVKDNILLPFDYNHKKVDQTYLEEITELLGIKDLLEQKSQTLSLGEKQRVAIARGLITKPALLLADEPTGSLDDENTFQTMRLFKQINARYGTTIIVVTHRKDIIKDFDEVYTIDDCKIQCA